MLAAILIISSAIQAQNHKNHPVDIRMEFYNLENDDNVDKKSFSLFTYLDADSTFGYYLGLGTAETFLEFIERNFRNLGKGLGCGFFLNTFGQ